MRWNVELLHSWLSRAPVYIICTSESEAKNLRRALYRRFPSQAFGSLEEWSFRIYGSKLEIKRAVNPIQEVNYVR